MNKKSQHTNYLFAGGGCAALSLLYTMNQKGLLHNKKAIVIDREVKNTNNRTWAFWTKQPTVFDQIVYNKWETVEFISQYYNKDIELSPYTYQIIRGIDFYEFVLNELKQNPNIQFVQDRILSIEDGKSGGQVCCENGMYKGDYVFDSCYNAKKIASRNGKTLHLQQHFKGWVIDTRQAIFDTSKVRLFDFRTPQNGLMRFFYIIPFGSNKALVEYTLFSESLLEESEYDNALKAYIKDILKINEYKIEEVEQGTIPMTTYPFQSIRGSRVVNIGTWGGCSKASTGYTFLRIQDQVQAIVQSIRDKRHPMVERPNSRRHNLYDAMLLKVIKDRGELSEKVFSDLFRNNPIERLFSFLDEESNLLSEIQVMSSVAPRPFIQAFVDLKLK